ncbi:MAG: hypothetical protein ACR2N7_01005 [Acidimicrobiia bacterium]
MNRLVALLLVALTALSACGSEDSTLAEYAADLELAVNEMNSRLDELDAELSGTPDLEQVKRYANERVAARYTFVEVLDETEPPAEVSDLHQTAQGVMERLADAESALAEYVNGLDTAMGAEDFWATPLGVAARTADQESIEMCLSAQDELDTSERSELEGVPWVPPELKEVVIVAFGCIASDR